MAAQQILVGVASPPVAAVAENGSLEVVVVHSTTKATLRNLRTAAELAAGLAARIRLLVLEAVPYPLDVETPRVPVEFTKKRFWMVASHARVDTLIDIRLGRDSRRMLEAALKPGSLVVLERGAWWTSQYWLARRLEKLGHQVVLSSAN